MQLTVLSVPGCPNLPVLTSRLHQLLTDHPDLQVTYQVVADATQAAHAGMRGSPTLLVDGVDPFAPPGTPASVTCRLYQNPHGRTEGAPSLAALRQALTGRPTMAEQIPAQARSLLAPSGCCPSLTDAQRAVHQAILRAFATTGQPPPPTDLEPVTARHGTSADPVLRELVAGNLLDLDPAGRVAVAYPFSAGPTAHQVRLPSGVTVWSMCAIDALGIAPMLDTDLVITSAQPGTDQPVTVTFTAGRARWDPPSAVVFAGSTGVGGPPSASCCGQVNFFTTRQAAQAWHDTHPEVAGAVLDQAQAQRLGRDEFGALLA